MRIYIAGASADREEIGQMIRSLPEHGCSAFDWTVSPGYETGEYCPIQVAGKALQELQIADALIWYVSERVSAGAAGEALTARALGLRIVVMPSPRCPNGLPKDNIWAHYLAAEHQRANTLQDALALLRSESKIVNLYEGSRGRRFA